LSTANKQSVTMLMVMAAGFHYLNKQRHFARVDLQKLCDEGYTTCVEILREWPRDNIRDQLKVNADAIMSVIAWQEVFDEKTTLNATSFTYLISRLLTDLQSKVKNKKKVSLLSRLNESVKILEEFTDAEGKNFMAYEQCDVLLDNLYEVINWEY